MRKVIGIVDTLGAFTRVESTLVANSDKFNKYLTLMSLSTCASKHILFSFFSLSGSIDLIEENFLVRKYQRYTVVGSPSDIRYTILPRRREHEKQFWSSSSSNSFFTSFWLCCRIARFEVTSVPILGEPSLNKVLHSHDLGQQLVRNFENNFFPGFLWVIPGLNLKVTPQIDSLKISHLKAVVEVRFTEIRQDLFRDKTTMLSILIAKSQAPRGEAS